MTARFQAAQVQRVVTPSPTIEGLPRDPEMAAGEGHVLAQAIKIHPGQPNSGFPAQLHPNGLQPRRPGWLTVFNLHPDTLLESVTHHSEREQRTCFNRPCRPGLAK